MAFTPRYRVAKVDGVDGPPVPDDEPCLVIRAQDRLALPMINAYEAMYRNAGVGNDLGPSAAEVLAETAEHRDAIMEWQAVHGSKFADR